MKKHSLWSRLLAGLMCLAMVMSLAVPSVFAEETEPVSLTENATVSAYTIADPANYYNNSATIGYITQIEEASYDRLLDGVTADQYPEKFDGNWVSSAWNDPNGGRYLFLNLYRGVSRDITIDLGQVQNVTEMNLHVGVSTTYGVPGPTSVNFYLSENGTDFYLAGTVNGEDVTTYSVGIENLEHASYQVSDLNYNARYVRLQFPVSVWVFLDELYVNGYEGASDTARDLTELEKLVTEVSKESYSTTEQSGGIMHDFLSYQGWGTVNGELTETYKTVREYEAIVAYLDEEGVPQDWLYDAVTMLGHASTSDGGVYLVSGSNTDYATKHDWAQWIDHIYDYTYNDEITNLDALNEAVGNIKATMAPSELNGLTQEEIDNYVVPVRLAVYPAIHAQSNWGSLEAGDTYIQVTVAQDGSLSYETVTLTESKTIDFTLEGHGNDMAATLSDRASAFYWYMNELAERWDAEGYENIQLHGFYYYEEKAPESTDAIINDTIKLYNMLVNQLAEDRGVDDYSSYWIPFYTADGTKYWQELGFDYAVMQPNAYNYGQSRLNSAADYAYFYGMGLEMEWMGATTEGYVDTFIQYMTTGAAKGYQSAPSAWYWGTWDLPRLCYNEGSGEGYRYVYDLVYNYISGNAIYAENILASAEISLHARQILNQDTFNGYDLTVLTDGISGADVAWGNGTLVQINTGNAATNPYELVAKLAETTAITELRTDFFDWTSAGVAPPYCVEYYVSADGESWYRIGETYAEDEYTLTIADGVAADYVKARIYCAINSANNNPYGWLGIAEFSAKGTATTRTTEIPTLDTEKNLAGLEDAVYTITDSEGTEVVSTNGNDLKTILTDGAVQGAWNSGYYCFYDTSKVDPFILTVDLGENCYVDGVSLSFYSWVSAGVAPPEQVSFYTSLDGESWSFLGIITDPVVLYGTSGSTDPTDLTFVMEAAATATARYVKVEFSRGGNKYSQIEKSNWIAFSELVIEGETLSGGKKPLEKDLLSLSEDMLIVDMLGVPNANGVTGLAAVDAAKGVLVDGMYGDKYPWAMNNAATSAYVGFQGGWEGAYDETAYNKGWGNDGYYIQVNLGELYTLDGVAIDFLRNNPSGIGAPDALIVKVSTDGENWTELGLMGDPIITPCTADATHEKLYYVMDLDGVDARYVRYEFKRSVKDENNVYSFVCFDEIILSGTEHTHTYTDKVVEPGCESYGYTIHSCTGCDYVWVDSFAAPTGHNEAVVGYVAPTCTTDGYTGDKVCEKCGHEFELGTVIPADPEYCAAGCYEDVVHTAWYHEGIVYVVENGIMIGVSDTAFDTSGSMSRGQLVTVLYRLAGEPQVSGTNPFRDVGENCYYTNAVIWAYENEIVNGISAELFAPDQNISREQAVTILYRYCKWLGMDVSASADLESYPDANEVDAYAVDAMAWAVAEGVVQGNGQGLAPNDDISRAQAATILMRLFDK